MNRAELVRVALGKKPADLVIKGGKLVNVETSEIEPKADVVVTGGRIALVGGGQVVVNRGKILARVELPIAGLMSDKRGEGVAAQLEKLHNAAKKLGIRLKSPFMQLAFLPLAVMPELRITDKGLVDVGRQKIVPLFVR